MKKKIFAGIIGLGVGEQHLKGFLKNSNCDVKLICDFDSDKLHNLSKKYPFLNTTTNPEDVLNDAEINLISIASYDNYHCEQILKALENNKNVFVEKPLCQNELELKKIINALRKNPHLNLSSNLILRKVPRFIDLKNKIDAGVFGKTYLFQASYDYGRIEKIINGWRGEIPFYSIMHGGGIHLIDLIIWLSSSRISSVSAVGNQIVTKKSKFKFDDCVISNLKLKDGSIASVTANFPSVCPHGHRISVFGEKASFHHGPLGSAYFFSRNPNGAPDKVLDLYPGVAKDALLNEFLEYLMNPSKNMSINTQDIVDAMAVSIAIERSINIKEEIKVDYHNI